MKTITITEDLTQRLVSYLGKKPYNEVYQLIDNLLAQVNASNEPLVPQTETPPVAE